MTWEWLEHHPRIVAIAGPNGAGKTTFYHSHISWAGLRFVNADVLASHLDIDAYTAATIAASLRVELVKQRESFAFETVFSDPIGDKLSFLKGAAAAGYQVLLCFVGVSGPDLSEERVAMRVAQGGHDVPHDKLVARFPRTMANLQRAIAELPHVIVYDNSDLATPFREIARSEHGQVIQQADHLPRWFEQLVM